MMRAIYSLLILIGVVTSFPCRSEITKGFSKILLKPNGEVSFSLTSGVKIICGIPKGQWEEMAVYLSSTREYFQGKKKLKKGDVLTDSEGNKICIILSDSVEYMPMHNTENGEYLVWIRSASKHSSEFDSRKCFEGLAHFEKKYFNF